MTSWRRALGLGVVAWLAPFVVAFLAFPFRESARPLFESIMAVAVTATAVLLGWSTCGNFRAACSGRAADWSDLVRSLRSDRRTPDAVQWADEDDVRSVPGRHRADLCEHPRRDHRGWRQRAQRGGQEAGGKAG